VNQGKLASFNYKENKPQRDVWDEQDGVKKLQPQEDLPALPEQSLCKRRDLFSAGSL
jgi:hypothetical protein